jgi:hypothetical protein
MIDQLLDTLRALKSNPGRAVELYEQLYRESFFALIQAGSETNLQSYLFLNYPTDDGLRELPLFTKPEFVLPGMPDEALLVQIQGPQLWARLLDIVETHEIEAAVDPGQAHGIRLTREMILGMIAQYDQRHDAV